MFTQIKAVRVQEVIMSGSARMIGGIRYNDLEDPKPKPHPNEGYYFLPFARPLFYNISQYPTVNEIVYILGGPNNNFNTNSGHSAYYLPPINIHGGANHNALPGGFTRDEKDAGVETGLYYFKEDYQVRPLLPYLGDFIIEGRYGNSIRFGSTISGSHEPNNWSNEGNPGNPITIISNGQKIDPEKGGFEHVLEDINTDNSSIYLCSNQQITNFQKAGVSPKEQPLSYKHML